MRRALANLTIHHHHHHHHHPAAAANPRPNHGARSVNHRPNYSAAAANCSEALQQASHHSPLTKIREGFQRFQARISNEPALFKSLAKSQHPKLMIFACSDSRVDPAITLGLELGEAFVVRNIASLVPPHSNSIKHASTGSAIEYAVLHLKVEHILIIGHSQCGGIKTLLDMKDGKLNITSNEYIEDWMSIAKPALKSIKSKCNIEGPLEEQWATCAKESVNLSLSNCLTYPFVKEAVEQEKIFLHGAYYDFVGESFDYWSLHEKLDT